MGSASSPDGMRWNPGYIRVAMEVIIGKELGPGFHVDKIARGTPQAHRRVETRPTPSEQEITGLSLLSMPDFFDNQQLHKSVSLHFQSNNTQQRGNRLESKR